MTMLPISLLILLLLSFNLQPKIIVALANPSDHDFRYMKSVKEAIDFPEAEEYDYIVVGGGTAGCPLAATLSEKHSVLVLERGNVPQKHPNVLRAEGFIANVVEEEDSNHDTPAERFTSEEGVGILRGRVLGGTSMINAGFFSRADEEYFGSNEGVEWDVGLVDEAYRWVEDTIVTRPENVAAWQSAVKDALLEAGVGPDNGFTLDHKIGTKFSGSTFDDSGRRHGAVELLNRGNLENLRVAVHASVERIMFSKAHAHSSPSAIGVAYTDKKNKSHVAFVRQKGEVILSAGALGSPQLLLLSGIGPESELSELGIPSVKSNPGVGKFMADNPRSNINLVIPFPLQPSVIQVAGVTEDYVIETISYSLSLSPAPMPFGLFASPASTESSLTTFVVKPPGPLSHGSLSLTSPRSVKTAPLVRFNYFLHPKDLERCVSAMRKVGEILESESLERFKYKDLAGERGFLFLGPTLPGNRSDDESMRDYCRSSVTSFWHYHGGCLVGKAIDGDFRVFGVGALRVVDGSTFSVSPGTNPQATLMMLGRYMGVKMLRERSGSYYSSSE